MLPKDQNSEAEREFVTVGDATTKKALSEELFFEIICSVPRHSAGSWGYSRTDLSLSAWNQHKENGGRQTTRKQTNKAVTSLIVL